MSIKPVPYIMLDGQAADAIAFYERALGAVVRFRMSFGEEPQEDGQVVAESDRERVAHAVLQVGENELYVADHVPGLRNDGGIRVNICLTVDEAAEAQRIYDALREGGTVLAPLQKMHFSPLYGMVEDRFGVIFQVFTKRQA